MNRKIITKTVVKWIITIAMISPVVCAILVSFKSSNQILSEPFILSLNMIFEADNYRSLAGNHLFVSEFALALLYMTVSASIIVLLSVYASLYALWKKYRIFLLLPFFAILALPVDVIMFPLKSWLHMENIYSAAVVSVIKYTPIMMALNYLMFRRNFHQFLDEAVLNGVKMNRFALTYVNSNKPVIAYIFSIACFFVWIDYVNGAALLSGKLGYLLAKPALSLNDFLQSITVLLIMSFPVLPAVVLSAVKAARLGNTD